VIGHWLNIIICTQCYDVCITFCSINAGLVTIHGKTIPDVAGIGRQRGPVPRAQAEGAPKGVAVIFLSHEIYRNSVSSVKAAMDMEGQIMCVEQCTFYTSSVAFVGPQNVPKALASWASL